VGADARVLLVLSEVLPDRLLDRLRFRVFGLQGKFGVRRAEGGGRAGPFTMLPRERDLAMPRSRRETAQGKD
jgi:hypothetical protein